MLNLHLSVSTVAILKLKTSPCSSGKSFLACWFRCRFNKAYQWTAAQHRDALLSSILLSVHVPCNLCGQTVLPLNLCNNAKHASPPSFFFFFSSNPQDITLLFCSTHVRIRAPQQSEGLVLQACHCSPDGSIQGFFQAFCTCLFISVKVRVSQRTVASCCILALLHRDAEDCYPLDRLAVILSPSFSLFFHMQVVQITTISSKPFLTPTSFPLLFCVLEVSYIFSVFQLNYLSLYLICLKLHCDFLSGVLFGIHFWGISF